MFDLSISTVKKQEQPDINGIRRRRKVNKSRYSVVAWGFPARIARHKREHSRRLHQLKGFSVLVMIGRRGLLQVPYKNHTWVLPAFDSCGTHRGDRCSRNRVPSAHRHQPPTSKDPYACVRTNPPQNTVTFYTPDAENTLTDTRHVQTQHAFFFSCWSAGAIFHDICAFFCTRLSPPPPPLFLFIFWCHGLDNGDELTREQQQQHHTHTQHTMCMPFATESPTCLRAVCRTLQRGSIATQSTGPTVQIMAASYSYCRASRTAQASRNH